MAKKAAVVRTRMSDAEVQAYLKRHAKAHDLKGVEFTHAKDRCAATRWAALERNAAKAKKPARKAKKK